MIYDTKTEISENMGKIIVQKCPVCGEAMIAGGTCDVCNYSEAVKNEKGDAHHG